MAHCWCFAIGQCPGSQQTLLRLCAVMSVVYVKNRIEFEIGRKVHFAKTCRKTDK